MENLFPDRDAPIPSVNPIRQPVSVISEKPRPSLTDVVTPTPVTNIPEKPVDVIKSKFSPPPRLSILDALQSNELFKRQQAKKDYDYLDDEDDDIGDAVTPREHIEDDDIGDAVTPRERMVPPLMLPDPDIILLPDTAAISGIIRDFISTGKAGKGDKVFIDEFLKKHHINLSKTRQEQIEILKKRIKNL